MSKSVLMVVIALAGCRPPVTPVVAPPAQGQSGRPTGGPGPGSESPVVRSNGDEHLEAAVRALIAEIEQRPYPEFVAPAILDQWSARASEFRERWQAAVPIGVGDTRHALLQRLDASLRPPDWPTTSKEAEGWATEADALRTEAGRLAQANGSLDEMRRLVARWHAMAGQLRARPRDAGISAILKRARHALDRAGELIIEGQVKMFGPDGASNK